MNLIICTSPLQVLIAERIIDLYPQEEFYGILHTQTLNEKYDYYYQRLANKCRKSKLIYGSPNRNRYLMYVETLTLLTFSKRLPKFERIFVASFDNPTNRIILSGSTRKAEIITFDDGTSNLSPQAFTQIMKGDGGAFYHILEKLVYIPTAQEIIDRHTLHYTIYHYPNTMSHTQYLSLLTSGEEGKSHQSPTQKTKRIFLGQAIYGDLGNNNERSRDITAKVIERYHIEYYFPHPKESYTPPIPNSVETVYAFEDFVLQEIKQHPDTLYEVYTFCSTAALNVYSIPQVKVISLLPQECPGNLTEVYTLFERIGIPIEKL